MFEYFLFCVIFLDIVNRSFISFLLLLILRNDFKLCIFILFWKHCWSIKLFLIVLQLIGVLLHVNNIIYKNWNYFPLPSYNDSSYFSTLTALGSSPKITSKNNGDRRYYFCKKLPNNCVFVLFFYWDIVVLQCCVSFCYTMKWISCMYTYIPSLLDFPPTTPIAPI